MRFAYADPPYPGYAQACYGDHADYAGEVDHAELIKRLCSYDGWALSTSNKTLRYVLGLVPDDVEVRIGAWTKPMAPRKSHHAFTAWEPVVFAGGRAVLQTGLLDWVHAVPPRDYPGRVVGIKPPAVSGWIFRCLGAQHGDTLDDLYPGSGAVAHAWSVYTDPSRDATAARDASPVDRLRVVPSGRATRPVASVAEDLGDASHSAGVLPGQLRLPGA